MNTTMDEMLSRRDWAADEVCEFRHAGRREAVILHSAQVAWIDLEDGTIHSRERYGTVDEAHDALVQLRDRLLHEAQLAERLGR